MKLLRNIDYARNFDALLFSRTNLISQIRNVTCNQYSLLHPNNIPRQDRTRKFSASATLKRLQEPLKWSYLSVQEGKSLLGMTVGQTLERAENLFGDREAVVSVHQNIRKTFHDLNRDATDFAAGLLASGFEPGDRLGIWSPNNYEWMVTEFAAAKAGLVLVNINPAYRPNELMYCLNKVGVKGIVCADRFKTSDYFELLSSVTSELTSCEPGGLKSKEVPNLKTVIFISQDNKKGSYNFTEIPQLAEESHKKKIRDLSSMIQFDSPCNIQFTSGTTGSPKGAILSHHNLVNNAVGIGNRLLYDQEEHRICVSVPLYHCFGCVAGSQAGVLFGATCIFPSDGFSGAASAETLEKERVTSCYGTPTMFVDILAAFRERKLQPPQSLITGVMAGAPCPSELVQSVMSELGMKDFVVAYGMTETSPVSFQCFRDDPQDVRSSTIGYPADNTEVKVVDDEGHIVPVGEEGELCVRGYCVFLGYWEDEEKTREMVGPDRWLKTGDQASIDSNGYCSIKGRIKDLIIRGGENIYPAELENFFMTHPSIREAQVFGVPDERMGEEVATWLRRKEGEDLTEEEFKDWCQNKIAHYKIPRFVLFKHSFPTTVTGKIQKFVMREETVKELSLL